MKALSKIQIKPEIIASLTFVFAAIWAVSALFVTFLGGFGKEFAPTALFWTLDYFFCPLVCAALSGFLVYDCLRFESSRSTFARAAIIVGFLPIVTFFPLAHLLAWGWSDFFLFTGSFICGTGTLTTLLVKNYFRRSLPGDHSLP
jgi:hypothetical protein